MTRARILAVLVSVAALGGVVVATAPPPPATAAVVPQLTRYPYLTDTGQTFATVNWGTDRSATKGTLKWGRVGAESCTAHTVSASKTQISVNGSPEYQWKAKIAANTLTANTQYCYRIFLGPTDLLGSNAAPKFWTLVGAGANTPYSFAVFGDWGDTDQQGDNPQQAALLQSLGADSDIRFALGTGDTAYDSGTQANYGDLYQTGYRISSIFGPSFWPQAGSSIPLFNAVGNHGMNATFFGMWPQERTVANSTGKYAMETYCCENGANSQKAPSAWYAFTAGHARFYILTSAWGESNIGTSSEYGMDYSYRWQQSSPEYQWLKNDLEAHPTDLKFAVFHYPLYSDNATEGTDPFLQGPNSLEGLLTDNGVNMVFNGHSHMYERNLPTSDDLYTYVSGGGGARLQPISHCQPYDAYGIGWTNSTGTGSKCGSATKPTLKDQVFHYLKVTIDGQTVTVAAINSLGQTFDQQVYDFGPDVTKPTAPSNLQATAPAGNRVDLTWDAATDSSGIAHYDIYRGASLTPIATVDGNTLTYSDTTVSPNTPYSYYVKARDPADNESDASNVELVTTPALDTTDPSAPSNLQATASATTRIDLTWEASTDEVGVTAYDIYRDGGPDPIDSVDGSTLSYSDLTVTGGNTYHYTVSARDAAGNTSADSNDAQATTPTIDLLFSDGFETGDLSKWTIVSGLGTSNSVAGSTGTWVARETASGAGATYAYKSISPTVTELYARFRFQVISRTGSVDLMRFRNNSGGSKLSLLVDGATGKLSTRNAAGTTTKSNTVINTGQWYTVEIHGKLGAPSTTEVWLDGNALPELGATGDLGSTNFGQFLLGHTGTTGTYDVAFDDVKVAKAFI